MTPSTPYLFVEIWVPKRAPYNTEHGWPCIVGDFVKPIADENPGLIIWFLQEGPWFQVCFAHPTGRYSFQAVWDTMRRVAKQKGFHIKRYIRNSTLGGALGGSRWMPTAKQGSAAEGERSLLLARACHAVCAVYLNSLVKKGKRWVVEKPECTRQNPHGNLFESFMHLVANISEARFDVELQVRTRWMHGGWQKTKAVCHL